MSSLNNTSPLYQIQALCLAQKTVQCSAHPFSLFPTPPLPGLAHGSAIQPHTSVPSAAWLTLRHLREGLLWILPSLNAFPAPRLGQVSWVLLTDNPGVYMAPIHKAVVPRSFMLPEAQQMINDRGARKLSLRGVDPILCSHILGLKSSLPPSWAERVILVMAATS